MTKTVLSFLGWSKTPLMKNRVISVSSALGDGSQQTKEDYAGCLSQTLLRLQDLLRDYWLSCVLYAVCVCMMRASKQDSILWAAQGRTSGHKAAARWVS